MVAEFPKELEDIDRADAVLHKHGLLAFLINFILRNMDIEPEERESHQKMLFLAFDDDVQRMMRYLEHKYPDTFKEAGPDADK